MSDGQSSHDGSVELNDEDLVSDLEIYNGCTNGYGYSEPYLKIIEQPQGRGFRFRYKCEGPSHGGIQGENTSRNKKSYPTVKIFNYRGPARIVVTLVTDEPVPRTHAHELIGKNCKNGICSVDINTEDMTATFSNLGVQHVTKRKVTEILKERILESIRLNRQLQDDNAKLSGDDIKAAKQEAEEQAKTMQLNVVRLCFQAYLRDHNGTFKQVLTPVISNQIYDSKSPGTAALRICRMDKHVGCCEGNEEVFLLCDKVQRDDVAIRFYEVDEDGKEKWESYGRFGPSDVHRQYAIVFKTPPYRDLNIDRPVEVNVQLKRMSDLEMSDARLFTYYPRQIDKDEVGKKRRKHLHFTGTNSGGDNNVTSSTSGDFGGSNGQSSLDSHTNGGDHRSGGFNNLTMSGLAEFAELLMQEGLSSSDSDTSDSSSSSSSSDDESSSASATDKENKCPSQMESDGEEVDELDGYPEMGDFVPHPDIYPELLHGMSNLKVEDSDSTILSQLPNVSRVPDVMVSDVLEHSCKIEQNDNSEVRKHLEEDKSEKECKEHKSHKKKEKKKDKDKKKEHTCSEKQDKKHVSRKTLGRQVKLLRRVVFRMAEKMCTSLQTFIQTGDAIHILRAQRHLCAVQDKNGDNALHLAIINEHADLARQLIPLMAQLPKASALDELNNNRQTALHLSVLTGQWELTCQLLKHGALLSIVDKNGNTPCHLASMTSEDKCLAEILKRATLNELHTRNYDGHTPLHLAVLHNRLSHVQQLVATGMNVNFGDGTGGRTPLHLAVLGDNIAIAGHLLLESHVDVNAVTLGGSTALHLAVGENLLGIAALIMSAGADTDKKEKSTDCDSA